MVDNSIDSFWIEYKLTKIKRESRYFTMNKKVENSLALRRYESNHTSSDTGYGLYEEALISAHNAIQRSKRKHPIDLTGVGSGKVVLFQSKAVETNDDLSMEVLISVHNAIQRSKRASC